MESRLVAVPPSDVDRVNELWRELTRTPSAFSTPVPLVVASDGHRASPPGWVGIIEIRGRAVVACPAATAERVAGRLAGLVAEQLVEPGIVDAVLDPVDTLGPALLFYGPATSTATVRPGSVIGPLALHDPRVRSVIEDATDAERGEAAIGDTTSGVYIGLAPDGTPAAACAWREWPHRVAHMSVLTAAAHRGGGYGAATARIALDGAVTAGLLPQWRAAHRNEASIALARRLGLALLGRQYSLRLD